jgi:two-component system sensor histidine kinase SenX3
LFAEGRQLRMNKSWTLGKYLDVAIEIEHLTTSEWKVKGRFPYHGDVSGVSNWWLKKESGEKANLGNGAEIPEILETALLANEDESMILSPGEGAIFQTSGIGSLGVLRDNRLVSEELLALVRLVRRSGELKMANLDIPRGPIGEGKRSLHVTAAPLDDAGKILVFINDESEQQRVDAVRRDFVANVSHELKTPIGALMLLSEAVLGAKDNPEEVQKFALRMQSESRRLSDLVKEIIDLSRLQSHDPLVAAYEVDIDEVVKEAINLSESMAEARQINISLNEKSNGVVIGDRDQLIMAVHNLIENAINYSPERTKVTVTISDAGELIEITVADQGIGIPENEQERIFERFYRVDPARSRETGGTGLGLSIVKHVALNHGGEINVWSREGVGSTFALRLPRAPQSIIDEGGHS